MNSTKIDLVAKLQRALSRGRRTTPQLAAVLGRQGNYLCRVMRLHPETFVCVREHAGQHYPAEWELRAECETD